MLTVRSVLSKISLRNGLHRCLVNRLRTSEISLPEAEPGAGAGELHFRGAEAGKRREAAGVAFAGTEGKQPPLKPVREAMPNIPRKVRHVTLLLNLALASSGLTLTACNRTRTEQDEVAAIGAGQALIVTTGTDVGALAGQLSVSPTGMASYVVPLWTPEGRNGVSPSLALTYSSGGGDGPMGVGWSLQGGVSMISRCIENSRRHARPRPIVFVTQADRFCLDGLPLVLIRGTHGAVNAEYRTEPDSFKKVIVDETNIFGDPTQFTVFSHNGQIHIYGTTAVQGQSDESLLLKGNREAWGLASNPGRNDANVQATYSTATFGWLRGSTRDRFSNTLRYRYSHPTDRSQQGGAQEPLLSAIEYVDVAGFHTRRIEFKYDNRPDPDSVRSSYVAGMPFKSTKLLASVDMLVAAPGSQTRKSVRFYRLTHETSAATKRPRLTKIEECDGNPATVTGWVCKKPTILTYSDGDASFAETVTTISDLRAPGDTDFWGLQIADMNNDGRDDIVYRQTPPGISEPRWQYRPSMGTTFGSPVDMFLISNIVPGDAVIADFARKDGVGVGIDGLPDIGVPEGTNMYAFYRNGGTSFINIGTEFGPGPNQGIHIADLSGKGLPTILRPIQDAKNWAYRFVQGNQLTPLSGPMGCLWAENFASGGWIGQSGDVDGDGAADFLTVRAGATDYLTRMFQVKVPAPVPVAGVPPPVDQVWDYDDTNLVASKQNDLVKYYLMDLNGDGLPDVLRLRQGESAPRLVINSGNGFLKPAAAKGKEGGQPVGSLDMTSGNVRLGPETVVKDLIDPGVRLLDFDGDGKQDVLLVDNGVTRNSFQQPTTTTRSHPTVLLSRNGYFEVVPLTAIPLGEPADGYPSIRPAWPEIHNYRQTQLLDANGDGLSDIVQISPTDGTLRLYVRQGQRPDLLLQVRDGMGAKTNVDYAPMTDSTVYAPGSACVYPQICLTRGQWLVRSYRTDNGLGANQNQTQFHYADARVDVAGGGYLGFQQSTVSQAATNTTVTETYDLDSKATVKSLTAGEPDVEVYARLGHPVSRVSETIDPTFTRTSTTDIAHQFVTTNSSWSYYSRSTIVSSSETEVKAGVPPKQLSSRTVDLTYDPSLDNYGILSGEKTTATTTQGVFTTEWSADYDNYPDIWLLGLMTEKREKSTAPGFADVLQTTRLQRDPFSGALNSLEIEPDDATSDLYLFEEFVRNAYGQLWIHRQSDHLANQRTSTILYDTQSVHPRTVTNSLNHSTTLDIDPGRGLVLSVADANNATTTANYDGFGRLRRVNRPGGGGMSVVYARDPDPASTAQDPRDRTKITTTQDGGGESVVFVNRVEQPVRRERKNLDGSRSYAEDGYSAVGLLSTRARPAVVGQPAGVSTSWSHDSLGRLTRRDKPEEAFDESDSPVGASSATTLYDALVTRMFDDAGRESRATADGMGRIVRNELRNDLGQWLATETTYGPFDGVRFLKRVNGDGTQSRISEMRYDNRGRRTDLIDPDTGHRRVQYNAFGDVRAEIDANGAVTIYTRDSLGRITKKTDKDGITSFTWDASANGKGKLSETLSPSGVKRLFAYDTAGRLTRETWTIAGSSLQLDYTFDVNGRLAKLSYPSTTGFSRLTVRHVYDANTGELTKVQNDSTGATYWQLNSAAIDGQPIQEAFNGNLVKTDYDYSQTTARLKGIRTTKGTSVLRDLAYDYWSDGNLRRRSDVKAGQHERFEYDDANRLKRWLVASVNGTALAGGWSVNYEVDDFGNLSRRHFVAGSVTGGTSQDLSFQLFPGTNRVSTAPWGAFGYDANGNQTTRPEGETVTYTAFDLPKLVSGGPRSAEFLYDASGIRARKRKSDSNYTLYVGEIYEKRVNGSATDHVLSVLARGKVVAQVMRRQGGSESVLYLHPDRLGSIDTVTGSTGGVVEQSRRDPYGNRLTTFNEPKLPLTIVTTSNNVRRGFTGHEQDDELGMINMRGREFDPRLGRFITPDPVVTQPFNSQAHNRYSYVLNNPLRYTDPTGFAPVDTGPGSHSIICYTDFCRMGNSCLQSAGGCRHDDPVGGTGNGGGADGQGSGGNDQGLRNAADQLLNNPGALRASLQTTPPESHMGIFDWIADWLGMSSPGIVTSNLGTIIAESNVGDAAGWGIWSTGLMYYEGPEGQGWVDLNAYWPGLGMMNPDLEGARIGSMIGAELAAFFASGGTSAAGRGILSRLGPRGARLAAEAIEGGGVAARGGAKAFHHTFDKAVESIGRTGLRPGSYATPKAGLSPLQAHIELALDSARGARNAVVEIDLQGLRAAGYEIPSATRVSSQFGMPGGGLEMRFPYAIPPEFIRVVQP
jgi:RHS repeat-associated protein